MTGWQTIDGKWYYLKADGRMASEWLQDNGKWYYLLDGAMSPDGSGSEPTTII